MKGSDAPESVEGLTTGATTTLRTFADLFCGIGGFHLAAAAHGLECVFASEIDAKAREQYRHALGVMPDGDIHAVAEVPAHDILLAGFPCQPFSEMGLMRGFEDARGTLFMEIVRVLEQAKPRAFVLENVEGLTRMAEFQTILWTLERVGYEVRWRVYDALDFALAQRRRRVWIVGRRDGLGFEWPVPPMTRTPLAVALEPDADIPPVCWVNPSMVAKRRLDVRRGTLPRPYMLLRRLADKRRLADEKYVERRYCATLTSTGDPYGLLVNGERRLTPREMLRLQGFPEEYPFVKRGWEASRLQIGNSLPVPVAAAVIGAVVRGADEMPAAQADLFGEAA